MFKKGDRIRMHDGSVHVVTRDGELPNGRRRRKREHVAVRGFVRGALVDAVSGETQMGDFHENVITTYGHGMVIRNFVGLANSSHASFWGIGRHTQAQSSNFSTASAFDATEWALDSGQTGVARVTVSAQTQTLSGTWTLSQSYSYASSQLSHGGSINAIAQYANSSKGAGTALSIATFTESTKGTTQALNVTYNWVFST